MSGRTVFEGRRIVASGLVSKGRALYKSVLIVNGVPGRKCLLPLTSWQAGPDMRTIAIPALPGAVDRAYIVSSIILRPLRVGICDGALEAKSRAVKWWRDFGPLRRPFLNAGNALHNDPRKAPWNNAWLPQMRAVVDKVDTFCSICLGWRTTRRRQ